MVHAINLTPGSDSPTAEPQDEHRGAQLQQVCQRYGERASKSVLDPRSQSRLRVGLALLMIVLQSKHR
jgi:hypothetical protein